MPGTYLLGASIPELVRALIGRGECRSTLVGWLCAQEMSGWLNSTAPMMSTMNGGCDGKLSTYLVGLKRGNKTPRHLVEYSPSRVRPHLFGYGHG
jgi:hypothetical protein